VNFGFVVSENLVKSNHLETNPYAAPVILDSARPAEWYLKSACRYFKAIGWVAVVYTACLISMMLYKRLAHGSVTIGEMVSVSIMATPMLLFFGIMIRTAMRLPGDFEKLHNRARWLGILAGAIGFPIFTVPAFIGVYRLGLYRTMINADEDVHPPNDPPRA